MYKLLIYQWDEFNKVQPHCYVFEFKTRLAVDEAVLFFTRGDLYLKVIKDENNND